MLSYLACASWGLLSSGSSSTLTAQQCAEAVWSALASNYTVAGTMGKLMTGDPWTKEIADYTDDSTYGVLVKKLLTTNKFIALK